MPWRNCTNIMLGEKTDTKQSEQYDSIYVNFNKCNDLKTCIINRGQIKVTDSKI